MALTQNVLIAIALYRDLLAATGQRANELAMHLNNRLQKCSITETETYYREIQQWRAPAAVAEEIIEWP